MLPFAEVCLHHEPDQESGPKGPKNRQKWQARFARGVWVGKSEFSDAHLVLTPAGVVQCRSVRRLPEDQQADKDTFATVRGLPWSKSEPEAEAPALPAEPLPPFLGLPAPDPEVEAEQAEPQVDTKDAWDFEGPDPFWQSYQGTAGPESGPEVQPRARKREREEPGEDGGKERRLAVEEQTLAQQALAQAASAQDSRGEGSKRERAQSTVSDESLDQEHKRLMVALAQFATVDEVVAPLPIGTPEGLDPTLVRAARALELQRLKEFGVYTPVPRSEADRVVATRWVEVQKAPDLVRSRLVAKDFALEKREDLFAAMPGLVATRLALAVLADRWACGHDWIAKTADVSVAFLHAPADKENPQYVTPPPDAGEPQGVVWRLERSLYGTRSAPRNWQQHLVGLLAKAGWTRGRADPATFFNGRALLVVHVDDFLCVGPRGDVDSLMTTLSSSLLLKVSEELRSGHALSFLGREISRVDNAVVLQPSSKLIRKLGGRREQGARHRSQNQRGPHGL